jgi:hypothetical protein
VSTLAIQLLAGQRRESRKNSSTAFELPAMGRRGDPRSMFLAAYPCIADACRAVDEPGLVMVAVEESSGRTCGFAIARARIGRHVAMMIGRHDRCDLYLDKRAALSLRQLVVVLDPVTSFERGSSVAYRILDLRTEGGFTDELGRPLRGLCADGPAVLRCAGYMLFCLPLGDATDWPADAETAWSMLPERVYSEEADRRERRSMRRSTVIAPLPGPRESGMLLTDGAFAGTLEMIGPGRHGGTLAVGVDALRDGLVLGRYVRCDGAQMFKDQMLSRVHVMLLQRGDTLLAIDTASTHGINLVNFASERVVQLPDRAELSIGPCSRVIWTRRRVS